MFKPSSSDEYMTLNPPLTSEWWRKHDFSPDTISQDWRKLIRNSREGMPNPYLLVPAELDTAVRWIKFDPGSLIVSYIIVQG